MISLPLGLEGYFVKHQLDFLLFDTLTEHKEKFLPLTGLHIFTVYVVNEIEEPIAVSG